MLPWRYIVVEGVIGVGKTSLTKLLSTRTGGRINLEVTDGLARGLAPDDMGVAHVAGGHLVAFARVDV